VHTARVPFLDGRTPDQIGIVVRDLEEALERYRRIWGREEWRVYTYGPRTVPRLTYRGKAVSYEARIALTSGSPQLELVEPRAGPSIYEEWSGRHGDGLHHLGFWVESLDAAVAAMTAAGHGVLQSGAGYGLDGDGGYAYFDTERELGVVLEAIEVPARRRAPDFTWPPAR
jgi:methylmalonyl-CoA/ethylmalonyl-CoA epimerase